MPIFADFPDIDLEMINILIKKEREEQNNSQENPFLQLPTPNSHENPKFYEKEEEKLVEKVEKVKRVKKARGCCRYPRASCLQRNSRGGHKRNWIRSLTNLTEC